MAYPLSSSWFVLQVTPHHEMMVSSLLNYKGYQEFVPTYSTSRRWSDRQKLLTLPLFPGYVFCRAVTNAVGLVRATPGVIRIVGTGGKPSPVPDEQIDSLRQVINAGLNAQPCGRYLKAGQLVQIMRGPLTGVVGMIIRVKKSARLVLSVDLTMKSVWVEIDASEVNTLPSIS